MTVVSIDQYVSLKEEIADRVRQSISELMREKGFNTVNLGGSNKLDQTRLELIGNVLKEVFDVWPDLGENEDDGLSFMLMVA